MNALHKRDNCKALIWHDRIHKTCSHLFHGLNFPPYFYISKVGIQPLEMYPLGPFWLLHLLTKDMILMRSIHIPSFSHFSMPMRSAKSAWIYSTSLLRGLPNNGLPTFKSRNENCLAVSMFNLELGLLGTTFSTLFFFAGDWVRLLFDSCTVASCFRKAFHEWEMSQESTNSMQDLNLLQLGSYWDVANSFILILSRNSRPSHHHTLLGPAMISLAIIECRSLD